MRTFTIEVKDEFIADFIKVIDNFKENVTIKNDKKLEIDPFFYERQKELQEIRKNIKNGKSKTLSLKELENRVDNFEKYLESKYAD